MKQYEVKSLGLTDGAMENLKNKKAVRSLANLLLSDPGIGELAEYVCFYVHGDKRCALEFFRRTAGEENRKMEER